MKKLNLLTLIVISLISTVSLISCSDPSEDALNDTSNPTDTSADMPNSTEVKPIDFDTKLEIGASAFKDNYLYFSSDNKIFKVDVTADTPVVTDVITVQYFIRALEFHGNELYIAMCDGRFCTRGKILKTDVSVTTQKLTEIIAEVNNPNSMALLDDELYVLERGGKDNDKIFKLDIKATNPKRTDIITFQFTERANFIAFHSNDLYIAKSGKVTKVDVKATTLTETEVFTGIRFPMSLTFNGNNIYVGHVLPNKISEFDITATTPKLKDLDVDFSPFAFRFRNNTLYTINDSKIQTIIKTPFK